jgi:RNA polymerase sigma-70 factor (ECF subfamily)
MADPGRRALSGAATPDGGLASIVRAAQRGDTMAMQELLARLMPYVGRLCGSIALDDGPDATQNALIAILRDLPRLREPEAIHGWARTIAIREAVRVARRARREIPAELPDVPVVGDPQLAADVRDVLARLSPDHRAVLVLRDLEGLDEAAASALLDLPPGTVKSRLHRARRNFREAWQR